jgi:superfamily II DNA or RNA helicase
LSKRTKYRPFTEARDFVRALKLKNLTEWQEYCKSGKKPDSIPSNPNRTYDRYWKNLGDWLGSGYIAPQSRKYRSFEEAREFVHALRLRNREEWLSYCKSGNKPDDIPNYPSFPFKKEWKGWGDWLGTGSVAPRNRKRRPFIEAREFVRKLRLKNRKEWIEYCHSGKKPNDISYNPEVAYKKYWKGIDDWLGTGKISSRYVKHKKFEEAREFVHGLGLKNIEDWKNYSRFGNRPKDIPIHPERRYKANWVSWGDWLGTGYIAHKNRQYRSFEEARAFAHSLKLARESDWTTFSKSKDMPKDIPKTPYHIYKKFWKSWGDWLGTGTVASQKRQYRSFEECKRFVRELRLKNREEWLEYCKSGNKPEDIPNYPSDPFEKEWNGWGDWLGTGYVAHQNRQYKSFEEAREFVHGLGLQRLEEWDEYCKSGNKPKDIPARPPQTYEDEWTNWPDWLGYEERMWSSRKVKELLRSLIDSQIIYNWDEAVLYSFLLRKGVLNLSPGTRHNKFFKDLIGACHTQQGLKLVEEYVHSESEIPPDLSDLTSASEQDTEGEIEKVSSQELAQLVEDTEPLEYGQPKTAEQILANTNILESINVDEEAMQFYLDYSLEELWKAAFRDKEKTIIAVKNEGKNGNKYHDTVVDTFLLDYEGTQTIQKPDGYAFPYDPTLMQWYVSYKVKSTPYFGNFSGTGAGKTLSAVLASRVIDSKMTVIVCPNDVVDQWKKNILEIFPKSNVITGKEAFYTEHDDSQSQNLVLNYDKFSQADSPNLILRLSKEKVDFIVLDEVHFVKKRDEESSLRRRNLDGLMTSVRKKNNQVKVLGLSATPLINNLMEGRSLLELITSKIYDDVSIKPTIPNAVTLYEKLSTISIRELPQYSIDLVTEHIDVSAEKPRTISIRQLKSNPLSIEQFLIDARIPEILKLIENQTIIYTEYVTEVIEKLSRAIENTGFSFALYTGSDRSGLKRFLDKKVQVLIASRPIAIGVDGLQHICNRLIVNTLPWTNAQYQQLLGRLVRKGQIRDVVHVYVVKASISGYPYDQLKWNRIQFKRTLADCAVDGRLPEKNLVTPQQAAMEAVKWLERIERGEVSSVVRRDLNVELTPVEIEYRVRKYGNFTRLNNQINNENSRTTHERMLRDPSEWEEYHRQYRENRKSWSIIPYQEIIKRTNQLFTSRMLDAVQIGDFGCGEAKITEAFGADRVYSFDHVAVNDKVIACDMKKVELDDDVLDVAVFSLSLMGKNWVDYIIEAKRCLAINGYLLIAETTKSMRGRLSKLRDVITEQGFEIYTDEEKGDFTFIEARVL